MELHEALSILAGKSIFFGHQSVGENILDGLAQINTEYGNDAINLLKIDHIVEVQDSCFNHCVIGQNRSPQSKIEHFESFMNVLPADVFDITFFKFCYVDIDVNSDIQEIFSEYKAVFEEIRARHKKTTFIHVSVPLTLYSDGFIGNVLRKTSHSKSQLVNNAKRNEFNNLLKNTFGPGDTIFDLASLESTDPHGQQYTFPYDGRKVPSMRYEYTSDGGHLNEDSRIMVAKKLVMLLSKELQVH